MNYSDMTFEYLLSRCLNRVSNDIDKREGSVIYNALAPACAELAEAYATLSTEIDRAFVDSAEGVDLTNKAKERGIFRQPATAAVRRGVFASDNGAIDVPIGSRFSGGDINYVATKKIALGVFEMTAEETGTAGNSYYGTLLPIDYIANLTAATLGEILIPAEDEETDESLRERYYATLESTSFGGNVAQYKEETEKIAGVGSVKVFPVWNGGGTVKLVFVDAAGGVPSDVLVNAVQTAIDPEQNQGEGLGIAPIGHVVTVEAASAKTVDVGFTLTFESGYSWDSVSAAVTEAVNAYFADLVSGWADSEYLIVRISQIESRVLTVGGVLDINNTTLNGAAENLSLSAVEIPVLGGVVNAD